MAKQQGKNVLKKKRSHVLTYLGVGVLLATFVAKDAIRDEVKDAVSALESAENMFIIRNGIEFTHTNVTELTRSLSRVSEELHKSKHDAEWFEERRDDALHEVQLSLVGLAQRLNNIETLTEKAPHPRDKNDLSALKQTLNEMYGRWEAAYKAQDATPQRILEVDDVGLAATALSLNISHLEGAFWSTLKSGRIFGRSNSDGPLGSVGSCIRSGWLSPLLANFVVKKRWKPRGET